MAGDKPGVKIDDYWEVGKAQLQDPTKFLDSLFKYDKVSIVCSACLYTLVYFEYFTIISSFLVY